MCTETGDLVCHLSPPRGKDGSSKYREHSTHLRRKELHTNLELTRSVPGDHVGGGPAVEKAERTRGGKRTLDWKGLSPKAATAVPSSFL